MSSESVLIGEFAQMFKRQCAMEMLFNNAFKVLEA
jgi:hypothetical protein